MRNVYNIYEEEKVKNPSGVYEDHDWEPVISPENKTRVIASPLSRPFQDLYISQ